MMIRFIGLALALSSFALAQTGSSAERVVPAPPPANTGIVNQLVNQIEGVPADSPARPERFSEFVLSTVGPVPLVGEAAGAGISQWMNSPEEWGQGWSAFGKRYWSNLAYNGIRQTVTYSGSLVLHEDTRYFVSGQSGVWPRARHALVSTFTARHANGRDSFSISGTAGVIAAAGISSTWGPDSWKGPGNIAANAALSFASAAAFNVVREFLPGILRRPRQ
jgi:hypothetical protein